eukprot:SAG22_NODE_3324_length_1778_cov_1.742108_2_plen_231_part_00
MPRNAAESFWSQEATEETVRQKYTDGGFNCTALNGYMARGGDSFVKSDDGSHGTPLFFVARGTRLGAAKMLLRLGADPRRGDEDGIDTPADVAKDGSEMKQILKREADAVEDKPMLPPAEWAEFLWKWATKSAPLSHAVLGYYDELLRFKNAYGVDGDHGTCKVDVIRGSNGGKTALMGACAAGNLPAVRLLVQSFGADMTKVDNDQRPVCVSFSRFLPSHCMSSFAGVG